MSAKINTSNNILNFSGNNPLTRPIAKGNFSLAKIYVTSGVFQVEIKQKKMTLNSVKNEEENFSNVAYCAQFSNFKIAFIDIFFASILLFFVHRISPTNFSALFPSPMDQFVKCHQQQISYHLRYEWAKW